jgi:hypothetical protein
MNETGRRPEEPSWVVGTAGALLLGGPITYYLAVHQYPLGRPEAIVLPVAAGLAGAAVALVARRLGGWLGTLLFSALLFVFVDLQFDLHVHVLTVILVAACVALSRLFRDRRGMLVCITVGVFYVAGLARLVGGDTPQPQRSASTSSASLPIVVHLILDEQWGIGGFRAAGDSVTAAYLERFYTDRGFEVYAAAYSRWAQTLASISDMVNLGRPYTVDTMSEARFGLRPNAYFARLRERGYGIRVYQSTFLDYCHTPGAQVEGCDEVSANSIANFAYFRGPWTRRALMAARYYVNVTSHTYVRLHRDATVWRRSGAGGGLRQLARVRDAIASGSSPGTAYFVHVLLPHRPTDVDAECRAHADHSQRVGYEDSLRLTDSVFRAHLALYAAQSRCAHRAVGEVLAALDSAVGRDGSIVIIHGDHGSRMSQTERADQTLAGYDQGRLNATFSTLLAVRRPGVPPAVHWAPVPTQDFLWQLIRSEFKGTDPGRWRHFVRAPRTRRSATDTLRELGVKEMLWARADSPIFPTPFRETTRVP